MRVFRPINNNIVSALDENDREVVVIGKGIGFKAREGAEIPKEKIDKVFIMSTQNNQDRLVALFASLPAEYIEITDEILLFAKQHLKKKINESAYFTLADHINFAVLRRKQGMLFQNALRSEIRRFYEPEFEIGLHALRLMKEKLCIDMPEDEAASIAMHILNAEYDISIGDVYHATQVLERLVDIIAKETGFFIDAHNYYYERFLTHLRFLSQRIVRKEALSAKEDGLYELLARQYPREIAWCNTIAAIIGETYQYSLSPEEISNLAIYLKRISLEQENTIS